MENTNVPVISAKDLNLWYGDFKALKSISLDVRAGDHRTDRPLRLRKVYLFKDSEPHERPCAGRAHRG